MDMQKAVESAMSNLVQSGKIEKMIESKIEETIKSVVSDALRDYSDFGKSLKEQLQAMIKINLKEFSLPEYGTVISNYVISIIQDTMFPIAKAQIDENLKKFLKPLEKDEYTISEIVEMYRESAKEWGDVEPGARFTARIEESSSSFVYLSIDGKPNQTRYKCQYRIGIHDGKIFSLTIDGDDSTITKNPQYHGFGDTLFKMYASGVKITDDSNEVSIDDLARFYDECDD